MLEMQRRGERAKVKARLKATPGQMWALVETQLRCALHSQPRRRQGNPKG